MNKLRLSGSIASLAQYDNLAQAVNADVKQVDNTVANFESQVQIDIKIVEVSRSKLLRYNVNFATIGQGVTASPFSQKRFSFGTGASANELTLTNNVFGLGILTGGIGRGLLTNFEILESNGFAYTLAEPTLIALSGQTATFLSGGEIPIPTSSSRDATGQVNVGITFKEFGIKVALSPTVLDNKRIILKVAPEVSELDPANGVVLAGTQIPALKVRRADTTVALGDGESFVISGLVSQNTLASSDKFPGLGNLPFIGAFFKSNHFNRDDRELVMIVTPHIVKPIAANAETPPLPGEHYRNYNPGFSNFVFKESGKFELPTGGFSK
jgi:pilus assembly protein CpaC